MKRNILTRTNLLVSFIIITGFVLTALLSYKANYTASRQGVEQVSALTSEDIYHQLTVTFSKPVNVSLTMANDSLLKTLLAQEGERMDDLTYLDSIREYLGAYRDKYGYDSVFLVSDASKRYYNFDGLDRVLTPGEAENVWYYDMAQGPEDYYVVVDNDEVVGAENQITFFVNCKLRDVDGGLMGVVGVGMRVDFLQAMLQSYQDLFDVGACLIDSQGNIQVSSDYTGYQPVNLFELAHYGPALRVQLASAQASDTAYSFWSERTQGGSQDYVVTRYLPDLDWYLVVDRDTGALLTRLNNQLMLTVLIIIAILATILVVITRVIRSFNQQIIALTQANEQKRQSLFQQATEQLYEHIYELDVTHDRPANRATEAYFQSLGVPPGTPYGESLRVIAQKQLKEEFRQGYIETFAPQRVQQLYAEGVDSLRYDFMATTDGENYYWMRITAQLVFWDADRSLHMLTYRQNIDAEKRQEELMRQLAQTDEMTGFLNKTATQRTVDQHLAQAKGRPFALFLFDIDSFKKANDLHGHAFGDSVIVAFTARIRTHFGPDAVLGRIGGDEFVVLASGEKEWVEETAAQLVQALDWTHVAGPKRWHVTASIGVALFPQHGADRPTLYDRADTALYQAKALGRNGYFLYHP